VASLNKAPETAAAAAAAAAGRLGRPLFCRNAAQAARAGMLGALVKLNLVGGLTHCFDCGACCRLHVQACWARWSS